MRFSNGVGPSASVCQTNCRAGDALEISNSISCANALKEYNCTPGTATIVSIAIYNNNVDVTKRAKALSDNSCYTHVVLVITVGAVALSSVNVIAVVAPSSFFTVSVVPATAFSCRNC